jgi:hypothetical protein
MLLFLFVPCLSPFLFALTCFPSLFELTGTSEDRRKRLGQLFAHVVGIQPVLARAARRLQFSAGTPPASGRTVA